MSDEPPTAAPITAGRLLREARQAQGLHIAALASTIKVAPRKLELLEADRVDELPDATFTRALAHTVCRALKIDPAPVLALLPRPDSSRLAHLGEGLNAPFRARDGGTLADDEAPWLRPAIWGPLLVLVIAAIVYALPAGWLPAAPWRHVASAGVPASAAASAANVGMGGPDAAASAPSAAELATGATDAAASMPEPGASAAAEPTAMPGGALEAPAAQAAASSGAADDANRTLVLHVSSDSWIEVVDGRGRALLARTLMPGESVALDAEVPLRLRIGNAPATEVIFRGRPVALAPYTRDRLARLELR
jgi:cytoskeleton protein RodZ